METKIKIMNRYWLFCYETYYPCGGMQDLKGDFDTVKECHEAYIDQQHNNYEIFDSLHRVIIYCSWLPEYMEIHEPNKFHDLSHLAKIYPKNLWNKD